MLGTICGTIGKAVVSNTRDLQFKSSIQKKEKRGQGMDQLFDNGCVTIPLLVVPIIQLEWLMQELIPNQAVFIVTTKQLRYPKFGFLRCINWLWCDETFIRLVYDWRSNGGRGAIGSSVDSSAHTILWSQVQIPSTPSILYHLLSNFVLHWAKDENKQKRCLGCRNSSVDSSVPTILLSQVQIPSTPSTVFNLLSNMCYNSLVKRTKINKKGPCLAHLKNGRSKLIAE